MQPAFGAARLSWLQRFPTLVRKTLKNNKFWFGLAVLTPIVAWYIIFAYRPIINAFPLSFQQYFLVDPEKNRWVGLNNFVILFENPLFVTSVRNTLLWAVLNFGLALPTALFISLCLVTVKRGRNFYQGMIYLPAVVSLVAISLLFRIILNPQTGQVNMILHALGLPEPGWLTSNRTALVTCVLIGIWKGIGGTVIILTAGMLNIPEELYDAAAVDGVNSWQRFWQVTLPLLAHTLVLITILMAIGSLQEFTAPFVLTGGGPGNATFTYNMLIYNEGFNNLRFGVAAAAALIQFALIVSISMAQLKLFRPKWSY
jgi:ABC-type sugar transport system permease subunit